MKNKKLHNIITHSNIVTREIVDKYPELEAKDICKINQLTDLFISVKNNKKLIDILQETTSKVVEYIKEKKFPDIVKSSKNYKKYKVGDLVQIIRTHTDDMNKKGIIQEVRNSFCKIAILQENGSPELNPQNNKPIVNNHTYSQFKKV